MKIRKPRSSVSDRKAFESFLVSMVSHHTQSGLTCNERNERHSGIKTNIRVSVPILSRSWTKDRDPRNGICFMHILFFLFLLSFWVDISLYIEREVATFLSHILIGYFEFHTWNYEYRIFGLKCNSLLYQYILPSMTTTICVFPWHLIWMVLNLVTCNQSLLIFLSN